MKNWFALPLRLGLGVVFVAHGLSKVFGMFGGPGIKGFSGMLSGLGFSPAVPFAYLVGYIELIGGLCLILGLLTRIAAILIAIVMLVALVKVHLANGIFMPAGFEYVLVILCACLSLMISGSGNLSITKKI